jgi:UDP-glucose:(heptosyl)LPS alpha-1,3-glucosyltransferase
MVADEILEQYPAFAAPKLQVVRNGYDPARFNMDGAGQLPEACESDVQTGKNLLFLGTGFERKGLDWALRFLAALGRRDASWKTCGRLWVAGRGIAAPYERLARDMGLEGQLCFLGAVTDPAELCRKASLMVLPTRYDPFANATLEALACGCPVVTTAKNGAFEVIQPGRTGWVLNELTQIAVSEAAGNFLDVPEFDRREVASSVAEMTRKNELKEFTALLMSQLS